MKNRNINDASAVGRPKTRGAFRSEQTGFVRDSGQPRKRKDTARGTSAHTSGVIPTVVGLGLHTLLLLSPFFRGLFFPKDQLIALVCTLGLFALWWWHKYSRGDVTFLRRPTEYAAGALVLAYLLSTFGALNVRSAMQETLKNLNYFLVLWLTLELVRAGRERKWTLNVIFVTSVLLSLLAIGAASKVLSYPGAVEGARLASSFQYANSLAAYLMVGILVGSGLAACDNPLWLRVLHTVGVSISLLGLVFTYSRGAWILLPAGLVVLLILFPRPYRFRLSLVVLEGAVAAGMAVPLFSAGLSQSEPHPIAWAATLAVVAAVSLSLVGEVYFRLPLRLRSGLIVVVVALALLASPFVFSRIPDNVRQRVTSIRLADQNAQERIHFVKDALKIVRDHPVLGAGGGGFAAAYRTYQSFGYYSTQVHNNFVQTLVETGAVGAVALLAIWTSVVYRYWRNRKHADTIAQLTTTSAFVAALFLGLHSALDFDLSLAGVSFALWALWGVATSAEPIADSLAGRPRQTRQGAIWVRATAAVVTAAAVAVFAVRLWLAADLGEAANGHLRLGQVPLAQQELQIASKLDPYSGAFQMELAEINDRLARLQNDPRLALAARGDMLRALALESTNPEFWAQYGGFALRQGDVDPGLRALERALQLQPFSAKRYEDLARAYALLGISYRANGEAAKANEVLDRALALPKRLSEKHHESPSFARPDYVPPVSTPGLQLYVGEALALLGRGEEAAPLFESAAQSQPLEAEARLWLGTLAEKRGEVGRAQQYLSSAYSANPALQHDHDILTAILP